MPHKADKYSDGDIGKVRVVDDFLPPPDALVAREESGKTKIKLSRGSVDNAKRTAKKEE